MGSGEAGGGGRAMVRHGGVIQGTRGPLEDKTELAWNRAGEKRHRRWMQDHGGIEGVRAQGPWADRGAQQRAKCLKFTIWIEAFPLPPPFLPTIHLSHISWSHIPPMALLVSAARQP